MQSQTCPFSQNCNPQIHFSALHADFNCGRGEERERLVERFALLEPKRATLGAPSSAVQLLVPCGEANDHAHSPTLMCS